MYCSWAMLGLVTSHCVCPGFPQFPKTRFAIPAKAHSTSRIIQFHSNRHSLKLISDREIPKLGAH